MAIPEPPDHIGWHLVNAGQRWRDQFVAAMQKAGYPDFTLSRANLLGAVDRFHGTRMVDLAARLGMTKQAVGQIVDDLVAAGYLARVPDAADGRAKRAVYTEKRTCAAEDRRPGKRRDRDRIDRSARRGGHVRAVRPSGSGGGGDG